MNDNNTQSNRWTEEKEKSPRILLLGSKVDSNNITFACKFAMGIAARADGISSIE